MGRNEGVCPLSHDLPPFSGPAIRVLMVAEGQDAAGRVWDLLLQIETERFEVAWTSQAKEAAESLCEKRHDVCLLDYETGVAAGREMLEELSRRACRVPVIVLTEKPLEEMEGGVADCLLKGELTASLLERSIRYAIMRHKAVESLREKEEDLNLAQAVSHTGSWRLDVESDMLRWSDETYRVFGVPMGTELTYAMFLAAVHPEDRERVDDRWRAALNGAPYDIEHRIIVDGQTKWVRERAVLEFKQDGSVAGGFGTVQDITELKLAESALRESEERFRVFMENTPVVAWIKDEAGQHVYVNKSFEDRFGLRGEDWQGKTDFELWPPEVAEVFHRNDLAVLSSGSPMELLEEVTDVKGAHCWWWVVKFPFSDALGRRYIGGVALDITERRCAEEAIRRSEAVLAQAGELAHFGAWDIGILETGEVDNESLYWSNEVYRIFGYEPGGVAVDNDLFLRHVHPEDWEKVQEAVARAINERQPYSVEHRVVRPDGSERVVIEHAYLLTDDLGRPTRMIGAVQDITERKQVEQALRKALAEAEEGRQTLHAIMEYIPMGIALADTPNVRIWAVSRFGVEMTGRPRERIVDLPLELHVERWHVYTSDGTRLACKEELPLTRATLNGELVREEEWTIRREDGTMVPVLCTAAPITDREGRIVGGILGWQDITERKQAEQHLKALIDNLARSNRELEQFAYVASHDLQEPLRQVTSFLQLLERHYAERLNTKGKEYIAFAVDGARRMYGLVNDLLAYSRAESAGIARADFEADESLDQALHNLGLTIRESRARIMRDRLPRVYADKSQLVQVFQNLLGNAIKFRGENDPVIHVSAIRAGAEWVFAVRDNGVGFPQEQAEQVFQLFLRLHSREAYGGTGIGLAICKRIIERHGGRIWAESQPGKGSTFYFTLAVSE